MFGVLFLIISLRGFTVPHNVQGTLTTALSFGFLAAGIVVIAISAIYYRRLAKRVGVLDALNQQ
jgi:hypothetical protein